MSIIRTIAPIPIEELRKYFEDQTIRFVVDYGNSTLKGERLLTYLGNLEIPCNVEFTDDEKDELLKEYFHCSQIVSIESLEWEAIGVLLEYKGLIETNRHERFIAENQDIIRRWVRVLESLTLYNMYMIQVPELQEWASSFPHNDSKETEGINFVSLLKHEEFFLFYQKIDESNIEFYSSYFNDPMFKGKHLFEYWASENNPMFLLSAGIADGWFDVDEYKQALIATEQELEQDAASV